MRVFIFAQVFASSAFIMFQNIDSVKQEHVYLHKTINQAGTIMQPFQTKTGLSVYGCVEECKLRKGCSFVNYHRTAQVCYMLQTNQEISTLNVTDNDRLIYAKKSDWNMTYYDERCTNCSDTQTCQLYQYPTCINTDCGPPPEVDNTTTLGNNADVGAIVYYKCQPQYILKKASKSQITCQENGTWSELQIQCWYPCRDFNWKSDHNSSCYLFVQTIKLYNDAKSNCEEYNAHLVDIGSQEEASFLDSFLSWPAVYIGLNDQYIEGEFRWSDNSTLENMLTKWAVGEPNNFNSHNEDCVQLQYNIWMDIVCTRYLRSICEYEL